MDGFEKLLDAERVSVERFVRFRISSRADADDVLQEAFLTAYQKFPQLKNKASFKAWIISIARNKCNDYFRRKAAQFEIPIDDLSEKELSGSRYGISEVYTVRETLSLLGDKDKQILYLYFWKELPQAEIAKRLNIPVGTVKSRLHTAKQNFRNKYPYRTHIPKGENSMKKLPEILPEYSIKVLDSVPFDVKCEELMGQNIIPRLGETCLWGSYDMPNHCLVDQTDVRVVGKAEIHGIEGVEIVTEERNMKNGSVRKCGFAAQLTDTHCRYLAHSYETDEGVKRLITFLDGNRFLPDWGTGDDNMGISTDLTCHGIIRREGNTVMCDTDKEVFDIVSRCEVTIGGKVYDTVCFMDIRESSAKVLTEQYIDHNGRTVLWRRFNRDDWAYSRYSKKWTEMLPESDRLTVNGETYVHWYDCITDYIL